MRNQVGRAEGRILEILEEREREHRRGKGALLTDAQIAALVGCTAQRVAQVRAKHCIRSGNIIELGNAAYRAGLTVAAIEAIAAKHSEAGQ